MTKISWIRNFLDNEKSGGLLLIACTLISIILANSPIAQQYFSIWHFFIANQPLEYWINDGLMAIFFFLIGLELLKEINEGELSNVRKAMLPIIGAMGGMLIPAGIYLFFNWGTNTQSGAGIPMATDIAFALGILSLLGSRVPISLKVFLTALAVIDDLGAIIVIAIFYTSTIVWINLTIAFGIFIVLLLCNKLLKINNILIYIVGGVAMWYFMLNSGIHATIAGVMLAFTIPYKKRGVNSPAHQLQHSLHYPVTFLILPLFALANTAIILHRGWTESIEQPFAIGILLGLIVGKPLGIVSFCYLSVKMRLCSLPNILRWKQLIGIGMLGGIGFTMSIFVTLLAFNDADTINNAKLMILFASLVSGILGYFWLSAVLNKKKKSVKL